MKSRYLWTIGLGFVLGLFNLSQEAKASQIVYGEPQALGEGTVRSFIAFNEQNIPSEMGMVFTEEALINLPSVEERYAFFLPLPEEANFAPFQEMEILWFPRGHDPGIYDAPHFHLSLFTLSQQELFTILPGTENWEKVFELPTPDLIPSDFVPASAVGLVQVIPTVGYFWADPTAPEFQGLGLTNGFLYTSYNKEIILYDWLFSLNMLTEKNNLTNSLKLPLAYSRQGYYPTTYTITFDEQSQEHSVSFSGLTFRETATASVPEKTSTLSFLIVSMLVILKKTINYPKF
ncbi:MAG: hypothetical protein AB4062_18260 [Crocosphaera sp.]